MHRLQRNTFYRYDALGRRVKKTDSITLANTRRYYYNYNWQILSEYDGSNNYKRSYIYGNYIDEVLMSFYVYTTSQCRYYLHDHLYSPAAFLYFNGEVLERYEYDAYGKCYIMDASYNPRSASLYGNPYYFTCREMDFLDNGNLKIMNYRHRYYDTYTGRFIQHDLLGITPNPQRPNKFNMVSQYEDCLNLYEYVNSNPVNSFDPYGLFAKFCCCTPEEISKLKVDELEAQRQIESLKEKMSAAISADTGDYPWFTSFKLKNSLKILDDAAAKLRTGKAKCEEKCGGGPSAWAMPFGGTVHICPGYWGLDPSRRSATLVHEGTHLGSGTTDITYFWLPERPHNVLIFGWDIIASTYDNWIIGGFCVPGYHGPCGCYN